MEIKPDITFEYEYIRVVFEVILSNLRTNKKTIEKELNYFILKLQSIKKKNMSSSDLLHNIKALNDRIVELENKFESITKEEEIIYECLKERIKQLSLIDESNYSFENLRNICTKKVNNLLLDYFLRERLLNTANCFIEEENINNSIEHSIFLEIQRIINKLRAKDITEAIHWCQTNKYKLTKLNSNIRFKLLKQQFIEIYKRGNLLDAVFYARENLSTYEKVEDLHEIMLLLAVKKEKLANTPFLEEYLSDRKWEELESDFKNTFFQVHSMKSSSPLIVLFQAGLMSLKTCFCYSELNKNIACPTCSDEISKLAKPLPSSNHPVSSLKCRITGDIIDHSNPPVALPNGELFSEKGINEKKGKPGRVLCPRTKAEYSQDQVRKVFIC